MLRMLRLNINKVYGGLFTISLALVVTLGLGVRIIRNEPQNQNEPQARSSSKSTLSNQFEQDIQETLEALSKAQSLSDWHQSGYRADDVVSAALALDLRKKDSTKLLCEALGALQPEDLAYFQTAILGNNKLPCKTILFEKIDRFFETEKITAEGPTKKPTPLKIRSLAKDELLEPREWVLVFEGKIFEKNNSNLLKALELFQAKAHFFIYGESAENHQRAIQEIADQGHILGLVGWTNEPLTHMSVRNAERELERSRTAIAASSQQKIKFFRFPLEMSSEFFENFVSNKGFTILNTSLDSLDWKVSKPSTLLESLKHRISRDNRGVLRLSSDLRQTEAILPHLLAWLQEQGYSLAVLTPSK